MGTWQVSELQVIVSDDPACMDESEMSAEFITDELGNLRELRTVPCV